MLCTYAARGQRELKIAAIVKYREAGIRLVGLSNGLASSVSTSLVGAILATFFLFPTNYYLEFHFTQSNVYHVLKLSRYINFIAPHLRVCSKSRSNDARNARYSGHIQVEPKSPTPYRPFWFKNFNEFEISMRCSKCSSHSIGNTRNRHWKIWRPKKAFPNLRLIGENLEHPHESSIHR